MSKQNTELQSMDWCQLSEIIMDLEVKIEKGDFSSESEFIKAVKLLDSLEAEKWQRVQEGYDHARRMEQMYQGSMEDGGDLDL
jgi:Arc/MetJ-type ribon-helix-helix transcriptional regulator